MTGATMSRMSDMPVMQPDEHTESTGMCPVCAQDDQQSNPCTKQWFHYNEPHECSRGHRWLGQFVWPDPNQPAVPY